MSDLAQRRWRLALGRYASEQLGSLGGRDGELDRTLDYLYSREYNSRGVLSSSPSRPPSAPSCSLA